MEFHWEQHNGKWRLLPIAGETRICVRPDGPVWNIYVNDRPLLPGNFSNDEGAKRVAWQFAASNCKALFGAYRVRLRD